MFYWIKRIFHRKLKKSDSIYPLNIPRFTETIVKIDNQNIIVPDYASFNFMHKEIFEEEIYKFNTKKKNPYIIDGGANIGLAIIYLKKSYPNSKIVAFEPDPKIFRILKDNILAFGLNDVELIQKGLWHSNKTLNFWSEGADGGLLSEIDNSNKSSTKIKTVSLNRFLNEEVDLLKLDIEGAETMVIKNIEPNLEKVKRIFIEYHSFVDKPQSIHEILKILSNAKFRLHINSPGVSSKSPFVNLNIYNNMDMQLNIYGFKEDLN